MAGRTIQDVIAGGDTVIAWCHNSRCGHHQEIDFLKLRDRLGPDHGAMHDDLVPKLRCTKCRGKKVGITVHLKSNEKRGGGPTTWGMKLPD
ncbi:hypothetical protein [Mesorhizobium sp. M6A.T.Ce.TU.016.01.1.1]|uniref:hypothetical protein n=1 Tax=Mesorhizobium sp. M6A.T.Ce.TU.016.01.1.1 TaxID=2496783 RepID=UPI000FCBC2A9|nr:hypothetical protein [Mesorhizobium sp. M6A.T.Ce.TU.016.01.1.1]RUU29786.1 hypothetical protein EOC94_13035 [Mesorhizobium sp. M6A.T.Ce.TU.016.01.1.1]